MSTSTEIHWPAEDAPREAAYVEFPWALVDTELHGIDELYATEAEALADIGPGQHVEYVGA